jgi:hypothetical protein
MKKDKMKNLLSSEDPELVDLAIIVGKEILSKEEKVLTYKYLIKKYPLIQDNFIVSLDLTKTRFSPTFTALKEYKEEILSHKITKDESKKFNRSANRVRNNRKSGTGTNTSKIS